MSFNAKIEPGSAIKSGYALSQVHYYARTGGDDANGGTNDTTDAVATWPRLFELADRFPERGLSQVLDGTGVDWIETNEKVLPEIFGGIDYHIDFVGGLDQKTYDYPLVILAQPLLVTDVTVTGDVNAAVGDTRTVTVSETLTPGAHVGQMLVGTGFLEVGSIVSNTANDIVLAMDNTIPLTAQVRIMEQSSTWRFGGLDGFTSGMRYVSKCMTSFVGIKFDNSLNTQGTVFHPQSYIKINMCSFDDFVAKGGGDFIQVDACDFTNLFAQNGAAVNVRSSTFRGGNSACHGEGGHGVSGFVNCEFDGWGVIGSGNTQSTMAFVITNSRINNSPSDGVVKPSANRLALANVYFENVAGDCINGVHSGARIDIDNCSSDVATCAGWGLVLSNGVQCEIGGTVDIEGTLGQVKLGAIATNTLFAAAPATDAGEAIPHFCRIF